MKLKLLQFGFLSLHLSGCGGSESPLPPDPHADNHLDRLLSQSSNKPLLHTEVSECRNGVNSNSNSPIKVCNVCVISARVQMVDDATDIVAVKEMGSLQFKLALTEDQPDVAPVPGEPGVWAADVSSLQWDSKYHWFANPSLTSLVGFQRLSGFEAMGSMTPSGQYFMPDRVKERFANDPTVALKFIDVAGDCPTGPA